MVIPHIKILVFFFAIAISVLLAAFIAMNDKTEPTTTMTNENTIPAEGAMTVSRNGNATGYSEIDSLKKRIDELTKKIDTLENRTAKKEDEESESSSNEEKPPLDRKERKQRAIERVRKVDEVFYAEARDQAWAEELEKTLTTTFDNGDFLNTDLIGTECKATFCRMEVSHMDDDSSIKFEDITHLIYMSYYIQHIDADKDGVSSSVAYFIRNGQERNNAIFELKNSPEW